MKASVDSRMGPQEMVFEKIVWSVEDVAKELQVSIRHIYKLVSCDKIPYSKVGRLVRFSPVRICEWLQQGGTR
jgi:excisionase family DNA binding protein